MKNQLIFSILALILIAGCVNSSNAPAESNLMHVCTAEEKAAEICTLEYLPVCGSDGVTYGNDCQACAADIISWVSGECTTDSSAAASSAPSSDIPTWTCESAKKMIKVCTDPVSEVCGNDNMTYDNGCRACSFGADSYIRGNCSTPNAWTTGFASLAASTNETRHYFDFSSNMIIEDDLFDSIMSQEVNQSDIYIDQFGAISGNCLDSVCIEMMIENELTYAQMQVMPNRTSYLGISGLGVNDKFWLKTLEGRTVKMEILNIDENNGIFFNWAIKI